MIAGVGGFVGMAGALGYGFKLMVDILGKQLTVQNTVISGLESGIQGKLDDHITSCAGCRSAIDAVGKSAKDSADRVVKSVSDRDRRSEGA